MRSISARPDIQSPPHQRRVMLLESITLTRRQMLATATVFLETELLKPKKGSQNSTTLPSFYSVSDSTEYFEISRTGGEEFGIDVSVTIGATWSNQGRDIEILFGEFSLLQNDPLIIFSNTWCALSQHGDTIQNAFNGGSIRLESDWDPVSYEPTTFVYGGAVGGMCTNLMTGNTNYFAFECLVNDQNIAPSIKTRWKSALSAESLS